MIDQIVSDILYFSVHYGAGAMAVGTLSVYAADKIRKRSITEKIYIANYIPDKNAVIEISKPVFNTK